MLRKSRSFPFTAFRVRMTISNYGLMHEKKYPRLASRTWGTRIIAFIE
jgi:hypothetical protein